MYFQSVGLADALQATLVLLAVALAFWRPQLGAELFASVERRLTALAQRPRAAVLLCGLLPVVLRVALLPVYPAPVPVVHDEWSHLLLADTFASGRLTNPPHPLWQHFETMYVLSQPVYTSKYQPGQAVLLALGQAATGHPWTGVLLSMGLLCALLCWALQGWLAPRWALLGGLLGVLQFGVFSYWLDSYWGGTVPGIGGALTLGALPRLRDANPLRHSLLLALGLLVLANSRPLEALVLGLLVLACCAYWLLPGQRWRPAALARQVVLPIALLLGAGGLGMGYYNWRVTGHALQVPYLLHLKTYGTPQGLFWVPPAPVASFRHAELKSEYLRQVRLQERGNHPAGLARALLGRSFAAWYFYCGAVLTLPLLFLPWVVRERRSRAALLGLLAFVPVFVAFHAWYPHYLAPALPLLSLVLVQCWRHLRVWRPDGRPVGLALTRQLPVAGVAGLLLITAGLTGRTLAPAQTAFVELLPRGRTADAERRAEALAVLQAIPGEHLVFVRYSAQHNPDFEWVYNGANIDQQRIVWARMISRESDAELVRYYPGRQVWIAEPDVLPVRLTPLLPPRESLLSRSRQPSRTIPAAWGR